MIGLSQSASDRTIGAHMALPSQQTIDGFDEASRENMFVRFEGDESDARFGQYGREMVAVDGS